MKKLVRVLGYILLVCVMVVGGLLLYSFTFVRPKMHLRIIERVEAGKCMCGSECPEEVSVRLKADIRKKWGSLEDARRRFRREKCAVLAGLVVCAGTCVGVIVLRAKRRNMLRRQKPERQEIANNTSEHIP